MWRRSLLVLGGAAIVLAAFALVVVVPRRRAAAARRELLDAIARASELDKYWSYDPASGRLVIGMVSGRPELLLIETRHGDTISRLPFDAVWPDDPVFSPGGAMIFYRDAYTPALRILDVEARTSRVVFSSLAAGAEIGQVSFSPDAKHLAYEWRDAHREALRILDLASGDDRELYAAPGDEARAPAWTPDGRTVYFLSKTCLRSIPLAGGAVSQIACVPDARSVRSNPDAPKLSPDGKTVAFDVVAKGCPRVVLADVESRAWRFLDEGECGLRPSWSAGPEARLAYLGYPGDTSRIPRLRTLGSPSQSLGLSPGVASQLVFEADGKILVIATTPAEPRAVWRIDPATPASPTRLYSTVGPDLARRAASIPSRVSVPSSDGHAVPVLVFPATCLGSAKPPLAFFLHGGAADISERFLLELLYFNAMGFTVVAPNFRGSTGYGDDFSKQDHDLPGQVADVRAALAYARGLANVDGDHAVAVSWSVGLKVLEGVVEADPTAFVAMATLGGKPAKWLAVPPTKSAPPVFWIYASEDDPSGRFDAVAERARSLGHRFDMVRVDDLHNLARHRFEALEGSRRLFDAEIPMNCEVR